jgi:hypothetical protein
VDDGGRTGRALHEFEFASGDILALRKAVIDLEAFELCEIVAVVRPQHPRTLRAGCRSRGEQEERDLSSLNSSWQGAAHLFAENQSSYIWKDSGNGDA